MSNCYMCCLRQKTAINTQQKALNSTQKKLKKQVKEVTKMEKFKKELEKTSNPWIKRIGNYLLSKDDIKENLKKENKSLKECFDYILIELSKKCKREGKAGFIAGDDEEIFSLAIHYYDEDNLKIGEKNFTTNADGSADPKELGKLNQQKKNSKKKDVDQKTIDQAVEIALAKYKQEEKEKEKKKKEDVKKKREELKAKKEAEKMAKQNNNGQLDLFELLGDENV